MPDAMRRIVRFCSQYSEDDPTGGDLCRSLVNSFVADDPPVMAVLLMQDDTVVGHLLLSLDKWLQQQVLSLVQFQLDRPLPRDFVKRELAGVEEWGRLHGCAKVQAFAISEKLARAYRVFHGFGYYATIVRKPLGPGVESGVSEPAAGPENP